MIAKSAAAPEPPKKILKTSADDAAAVKESVEETIAKIDQAFAIAHQWEELVRAEEIARRITQENGRIDSD